MGSWPSNRVLGDETGTPYEAWERVVYSTERGDGQ